MFVLVTSLMANKSVSIISNFEKDMVKEFDWTKGDRLK
jgi:hypothetical protein